MPFSVYLAVYSTKAKHVCDCQRFQECTVVVSKLLASWDDFYLREVQRERSSDPVSKQTYTQKCAIAIIIMLMSKIDKSTGSWNLGGFCKP